MQITAIILAGGKSSRMGTDKSFIEINGKTLLESAIELCRPIFDFVLISSNNPVHKNFGVEIIPDEILDCGPIGGIYSCLKKSDTDWNFVISVDAAFVNTDFVKYLISEIDEYDAVIPIHSNGIEPLIALYHKNSLNAIEKRIQNEDFKMHNLINSIHTKWIDSKAWTERYPKLFYNLNRPEDFNVF